MDTEIPGVDLEALIAAEYAAIRKHVEERLVPLLVERALRRAAPPSRTFRPAATQSWVPTGMPGAFQHPVALRLA